MDKIENIQKKPDYIKKRILFASLAIIMFVIIAVWVSTSNITARAGENQGSDENPASPFAVIRDIVSDGVKLIKFR